jgi:hypothetical protein
MLPESYQTPIGDLSTFIEHKVLQLGTELSQGGGPRIPHSSAVQVHMLEGSTAAPGQSHHSSVTNPCIAKIDPLEGWTMLPESYGTRVGDLFT